jgi:hypothetical protein
MASASISHEVEATQNSFPSAQARLVDRAELRAIPIDRAAQNQVYYTHGLSRSDFSARNSQSDTIDRSSADRDHPATNTLRSSSSISAGT